MDLFVAFRQTRRHRPEISRFSISRQLIMKYPCYLVAFGSAMSTAALVKAPTSLATLTITIPTQGSAFTSTVPGCDDDGTTVDPFAVVGIPNGTFYPGTQTYYVPAQASATSSTFVNYQINATEVIIITPLVGTCQAFVPSQTATGSESGAEPSTGPSGNPDVCAFEGCSNVVNQGAKKIIDALNGVTIVSQNLQAAAKQLGLKRDVQVVSRSVVGDLLQGLRQVPTLLTGVIPYIQYVSHLSSIIFSSHECYWEIWLSHLAWYSAGTYRD